MSDEKPKLALRVFKRTSKHLILLWRRTDGVDLMNTEVVFQDLKAERTKSVQVDAKYIHFDESIDEPTDGQKPNISADTVICMVKEKDAGLDPSSLYYVKVRYGDDEEGIRITPAGVYPSQEREDRNKNIHNFGWDDKSQMWRKLSAVKGPNNQWFLGVSIVPCPDCGGQFKQEEGD